MTWPTSDSYFCVILLLSASRTFWIITCFAAAKQVIIQKVREAERSKITQKYESLVGQVISGQVKRINRDVKIDTINSQNDIEGLKIWQI